MEQCRWLHKRKVATAVTAAFAQACREAGIPAHLPPDGACPASPCPCKDPEIAARVERRAGELAAAALGLDPADLLDGEPA
jgi:hypothetical protein